MPVTLRVFHTISFDSLHVSRFKFNSYTSISIALILIVSYNSKVDQAIDVSFRFPPIIFFGSIYDYILLSSIPCFMNSEISSLFIVNYSSRPRAVSYPIRMSFLILSVAHHINTCIFIYSRRHSLLSVIHYLFMKYFALYTSSVLE